MLFLRNEFSDSGEVNFSEAKLSKLLTVEDIQVEMANMETLGQKTQSLDQRNYFD